MPIVRPAPRTGCRLLLLVRSKAGRLGGSRSARPRASPKGSWAHLVNHLGHACFLVRGPEPELLRPAQGLQPPPVECEKSRCARRDDAQAPQVAETAQDDGVTLHHDA